MRYDRPELQEELASRYALGTMRGKARRRLERLMARDPAMADRVRYWEGRLNGLIEALPPVEPPPRVWAAIQASIGGDSRADILHFPAERAALPRRVAAGWRNFGLAAAALAALLAIYIGVSTPGAGPQAGAIAVLNDQSGHAAFIATGLPDRRRIALTRIGDSRPANGRAYQLWLLPKGGKPKSIGVLPETVPISFTLSSDDASALGRADGVAISLEPAGGSPTGQPTGPILFTGAVLSQ